MCVGVCVRERMFECEKESVKAFAYVRLCLLENVSFLLEKIQIQVLLNLPELKLTNHK